MQAAKNGETDACADLDRVIVAQRFIRCVSKLHRPFRDTSRRVRQKYLQTMLLLCRIACVASSAANQDNTLTSRRNFSEPGESMKYKYVLDINIIFIESDNCGTPKSAGSSLM